MLYTIIAKRFRHGFMHEVFKETYTDRNEAITTYLILHADEHNDIVAARVYLSDSEELLPSLVETNKFIGECKSFEEFFEDYFYNIIKQQLNNHA